MPWDFNERPELPNSQVDSYYWDSPHKQIFNDFPAKCIKVVDGDTIRVSWEERNFDFPIRLIGIDAPELNEGGRESKEWLRERIEGEDVEILIDPRQRVGKWGRILGTVIHNGINMNEQSMNEGQSIDFANRKEGEIPTLGEILKQ